MPDEPVVDTANITLARTTARVLLGVFLVAAGIAHLVIPAAFLVQVPAWMPWPDAVVFVSGLMEVGLGAALLLVRDRSVRRVLGVACMGFLAAIWVGNIAQAVDGRSGFGLTTDLGRWTRVAAQPLLILWAGWATGALPSRTARADRASAPE